ncbi:hypothetical protein [Propionibacterium freudenreichii]|uniref:hypothetical protein n=1 Tax=Propionibacterium freudenreichii TaxID=1744 RepID=UPI0012FDC027|nr:hypothetical protein [Propionibacterium freudenreichii]
MVFGDDCPFIAEQVLTGVVPGDQCAGDQNRVRAALILVQVDQRIAEDIGLLTGVTDVATDGCA